MMDPKQDIYWKKLEKCLSKDRLSVYLGDGVSYRIAAARYLWNIAICESLYAPLQMVEVGLRNAIDQSMLKIVGEVKWYDQVSLTTWGYDQVGHAKTKISRDRKQVTAGRVIAELHFGFWTSMFESHYEQSDAYFLPQGIKLTFPYLVKSLHNRKKIKSQLDQIRKLRNRVFHHERVIHWQDLPEKYDLIIQTIGWMSTDLEEISRLVDSFHQTYRSGIQPFLARLDQITPESNL